MLACSCGPATLELTASKKMGKSFSVPMSVILSTPLGSPFTVCQVRVGGMASLEHTLKDGAHEGLGAILVASTSGSTLIWFVTKLARAPVF